MKRFWYIALASIIPLAAVVILGAMGREPIYVGGYVKFWHGLVVSSENSQHLFDWYTFTHIVHGLGFFLLLTIIEKITGKKIGLPAKYLIALFLESSWEILENTDSVINHYRTATISLDYFGDSIINSIGDIIAMIVGFWFASRSSVRVSVIVFIALEILLLIAIKDNLILNLIMLAYPIEAIRLWQSGS